MSRYFYSKASAILFFIVFALVGALGYGWWTNYATNLRQDASLLDQKMQAFMSQGKRFTARDGQELCLRVQRLEPQPQPCRYSAETPDP